MTYPYIRQRDDLTRYQTLRYVYLPRYQTWSCKGYPGRVLDWDMMEFPPLSLLHLLYYPRLWKSQSHLIMWERSIHIHKLNVNRIYINVKWKFQSSIHWIWFSWKACNQNEILLKPNVHTAKVILFNTHNVQTITVHIF